MPVFAEWDLSLNTGFVDFDLPLQVGPLDDGNWEACANNVGRDPDVVSVTVPNTRVRLANVGLLPACGFVNKVDFTPPPFDLIGANGTPVAAFADFPMNVVP